MEIVKKILAAIFNKRLLAAALVAGLTLVGVQLDDAEKAQLGVVSEEIEEFVDMVLAEEVVIEVPAE